MSGKTLREALAALSVAASMVFVGLQIRQSNTQARAAAFQEIGIATAESHRDRLAGGRIEELNLDAEWTPERLATWTRSDWQAFWRQWVEILRLYETLQLQVEQGLLPDGAVDRLGYSDIERGVWNDAGFVCLWPFRLSGFVGEATREAIEAARPADTFDCSHIDLEGIHRLQVEPQPRGAF